MRKLLLLFYLYKLRDETHVEFNEDFRALVTRLGAGALGITAQYTNTYTPAFNEEVSLLDLIRNSKYTPLIERKDDSRDHTVRGFTKAVEAATLHPDPDTRAAAVTLLAIIKHYGDVSRKNYDDQTAAVDDMIRELELADNKALLVLLGLLDWLTRLKAENKEFVDLMRARDDEVSQRPHERMKDVRAVVDEALYALLDRIEAMITLNGIDYTTALAPFVDGYNTIVERYKRRLAIEKGRRAAAKDKDEENDEL
jgi:hypothetical protein